MIEWIQDPVGLGQQAPPTAAPENVKPPANVPQPPAGRPSDVIEDEGEEKEEPKKNNSARNAIIGLGVLVLIAVGVAAATGG